jgi:hypothetical protein
MSLVIQCANNNDKETEDETKDDVYLLDVMNGSSSPPGWAEKKLFSEGIKNMTGIKDQKENEWT